MHEANDDQVLPKVVELKRASDGRESLTVTGSVSILLVREVVTDVL